MQRSNVISSTTSLVTTGCTFFTGLRFSFAPVVFGEHWGELCGLLSRILELVDLYKFRLPTGPFVQ